jgi:hypothetical protein
LKGVKVILLSNVKGAANKALTTGLMGEVQSFQDLTVCELRRSTDKDVLIDI